MNEMTTSETLNRAADLIEERGWTKGSAGWLDDSSLCFEGGIIGALGLNFLSVDLQVLWDCPAYAAVQSYLGFSHDMTVRPGDHGPSPVHPLWGWNDEQKKASAVIETLRACAVIEASRARETAEVSA